MTYYYTWQATDKDKAQAMLDAINNHPLLPITGTCQGMPAYDKPKTTRWADEITEYTDGRWGFQCVPSATMDMLNVSSVERSAMLDTYSPVIVAADTLPLSVAQQYALDNPEIT